MNAEPENLYPEYRQAFTQQLVQIMSMVNSLRIVGLTGSGKSKYLRYISSSPALKQQYWLPNKLQLSYCDLNLMVNSSQQDLITRIAQTFTLNQHSLIAIEDFLTHQATEGQTTYLILDHATVLQECPNNTIRLLRALRDKFKTSFAYLLAYDAGKLLDTDKLQTILEISSIELEMPPLGAADLQELISHFATQYHVQLSETDITKIAEFSRGLPKYVKQIIIHVHAGFTVEQAIMAIQKIDTNRTQDQDYFLQQAQNVLTKLEHSFFKILYQNQPNIVSRDSLALLVSPESNGDGVSNEAIDQIVSRLRKKLKSSDLPFSIKTRRGIGYFLE